MRVIVKRKAIRILSWPLTVHNPSPDVDDVAENRSNTDYSVTLTTMVSNTDYYGMEWHQIYSGDYSAERISQQNILREASGPIFYACRNKFAGSPASACCLLFDSFILKHISKCTMTDYHRQPQNQAFAHTVGELEAFTVVM